MPILKPQYIDTVSSFIDYIERFKELSEKKGKKSDLLFRGQGIDKPLIPKIGRLRLRVNDDILETEKLILEEFRRGIIPLTEFKPDNNWDLLALAQHHGLPTRLLDWSYSALVALWFAVDKPPQRDDKSNIIDGVLWVLNPEIGDFRTDTSKVDPLDNNVTKIFRSTVVSRRISAQSGVFTVHKILKNNKMVNFELNNNFKSKLTKILIKGKDFSKMRKQLSMLGINYSTIYPDIDGFCRNLEWRYAKNLDE